MWLLELHLVISVLCIITFIGFVKVCKEQIKENGWLNEEETKASISKYAFFFVPLMNVLMVVFMFMAIIMDREDFEDMSR